MRLRESWRSLALLLAATALSAGLVEGTLRLFYFGSLTLPEPADFRSLRQPHPTRGWALRPNRSLLRRTLDYSVRVTTNSLGLRDVERTAEPAADSFRIVVLGDSYMEAAHVALEESFSQQLERRLSDRGVEAVNLGVGGYGTAQELIYLREEGLGYRPRLVLLGFYPDNDIRNNSLALELALWGRSRRRTTSAPFARLDAAGELRIDGPDHERNLERAARAAERRPSPPPWWSLERSVAYTLADRLIERRREAAAEVPGWDPNVLYGPHLESFDPSLGNAELTGEDYERLWREANEVTLRLLLEARDTARAAGAEFVAFLVPSKIQCSAVHRRQVAERYPGLRLDPGRAAATWRRLAGEHDLPLLDLVTPFQAAEAGGGSLFHRYEDSHWNAAGHRLAAEIVADYLTGRELVPAPDERDR